MKGSIKIAWSTIRSSPMTHPAFEGAVVVGEEFVVSYPDVPWVSKTSSAQEHWAKDTLKHLRSWGIVGRIKDAKL